MAIRFAPKPGTVVTVDFDQGFKVPEMVKRRLAVVISPVIKERGSLLTVVPFSTTVPDPVMPYHCEIDIPFQLPAFWGQKRRWLKGDMINVVGFHRVDLLFLNKDQNGKRLYQMQVLPPDMLFEIRSCVLRGLGYDP